MKLIPRAFDLRAIAHITVQREPPRVFIDIAGNVRLSLSVDEAIWTASELVDAVAAIRDTPSQPGAHR